MDISQHNIISAGEVLTDTNSRMALERDNSLLDWNRAAIRFSTSALSLDTEMVSIAQGNKLICIITNKEISNLKIKAIEHTKVVRYLLLILTWGSMRLSGGNDMMVCIKCLVAGSAILDIIPLIAIGCKPRNGAYLVIGGHLIQNN